MFENIKSKFRMPGRKSLSLVSPELANYFHGVYSALFTPGQPVYTEITTQKAVREGYKMAIPIYRALRAIIQAGSGIPWIVREIETGEEVESHPFTVTWAHPNREFSGQDNMEYIIAHMKLGGNAYIRPIYGTDKIPREFWVEMPDLIQPVPSANRETWLDGYDYTLPNGGKVRVARETFVHFMQLDPGNLYTGLGDIFPAARVIDTYNEGIDTQKVSMQNRGMPSGMLTPEEPLTPEQFDEFKRKFAEGYISKNSRREPWLFPRKVNWHEMSNTPVEMDYTNSQRELIRQMAAAIGVDPWWVGDREHSSFNNVKEARRSLYEDVVIPILDDIKATLNLKMRVMYPDADRIEIGYDISNVAALREDFGQKVEHTKTLWAMGVPFEQINQKLELGFDEFPGWERSYLPFSVAPVGDSGAVEVTETPETDEKTIKTDEEQKIAEWKRVDSRRRAWERVMSAKFEPLYKELGNAIARNITDVDIVIDKQADKWEKVLQAAYFSIIEDFGTVTAERLKTVKTEVKFDPFATYVRAWVTNQAGKKIKTILDTQKEEVRQIIAQGASENLSNAQIAKSLRQFYTDRASMFAMRVARTESVAAASFGQESAAKESGFSRKRWISSRDDRVRDDHVRMDGETVGINETFSNGCDAPGIGGDAAEVINCRCTMQFYR